MISPVVRLGTVVPLEVAPPLQDEQLGLGRLQAELINPEAGWVRRGGRAVGGCVAKHSQR